MFTSPFRPVRATFSGKAFGLMGQQIYVGFWLLFARIGGLFLMMLTLVLSLSLHYLIIDHGVSALTMLFMITLTIPGTLFVVIPFSAILSAIMLLHRLNQQNELIIMRTMGFDTWRIIKPIALIGLLLATVGWVNGLIILPESSQTFNKTNRAFRTQEADISLKPGRFNHFGDNMMLYARAVTEEDLYQDLIISIEREDGNNQILIAKTGQLQEDFRQPGFLLRHGASHEFDTTTRKLNVTQFNSYQLRLSESEVADISYWMKSSERYIPDLLFPDRESPADLSRYNELVTKGHDRLITPLYFFLLPLIAALLMIHAPFDRRRFIGKVLSVAGFTFGLYILHRVGLNMAADSLQLLVVPYAILLSSIIGLILLIRRKNPIQIDITEPLRARFVQRFQARQSV